MSDADHAYQRRLRLIQRLSQLSPAQLDQVSFALAAPSALMPPAMAKPGDRASALLQWAESEIGCGTEKVEQTLNEVVNQSGQPTAAPTPTERRDVSVGESVSRSNVVSGDGNRIEVNHYYGLPDNKPAAKRSDRNEKILIDAVWTEVEDRLRQSLHNAILIRLDMAEQRYQVSRPWDSQLRTADQSPKALPPNTHIADVFDRRDVGGKLLILGNPGSGKTTTMLDLAAVLIQRANDDPQQPIPVMVNLSSWQNANQSLIDWLINELKLKYGVSPKLGKTWLAQKTLLPLLDGLDELPPVRQEPVVQAINDWLQSGDGPTTLLICSRFEEYELYETQLGLNAAICLEPLTDAQLQDYLHALNSDYLWQTLHHDKELLALVRTPLLLSVTMLAQDGLDAQQWQQKPTTIARLEYLLDAYIERRLHEQIRSAEYSMASLSLAKRTRARLVWLAQNLSTSFIDSFSTEEIQSEILDWKIRRVYEVVSSIGFGVLIALIHYLLSTFLFDLISLHFFEIFEPSQGRINEESLEGFIYPYFQGVLWSGVFSGAVGTHFGFRVSRNNIEFTETISIQEIKFHSFKKWMLLGFSWGCIFMLSTSVASLGYWLNSPRLVTMYRNYSVESAQELSIQSIVQAFEYLNNLFLVYLFFLAFFWMVFWIFFGVFKGLGRKAESKVSPHQGMQQNFKLILNSFLLFCGLFMMSFLGFYLSTQEPNINLQDIFKFTFLGVFCSLLMSIASVGWPCIQHFILRLLLFRSQDIPWNYTRFLNYCTDRLLLQRVGGRYRFIHKLLQEHFAAMPLR